MLNQVLDQVTDEKLTPGLREHFRDTAMEIFIEKPSRMFATDMVHLMDIHSLKNLEEEGALAVKKGITSISLTPSLQRGFSQRLDFLILNIMETSSNPHTPFISIWTSHWC